MRPMRRRALIALAVLLPAALVLTARQVGAPRPAAAPAADRPPVFVGRVTPAGTAWTVGRPLRVTVELSADRPVPLAGIRLSPGDGPPVVGAPFTVGTEPRTVPFDVVLPTRGGHTLTLQVRLTPDTPWTPLPPTIQLVAA